MTRNGQGQCNVWTSDVGPGDHPSSEPGKVRDIEIITQWHEATLQTSWRDTKEWYKKQDAWWTVIYLSYFCSANIKKQILSFMSSEESERYWVSLSFPFIKHGLRGEDQCRGLLSWGWCIISTVVTSSGPIVNISDKDLPALKLIKSHCLKRGERWSVISLIN